MQNTITSEKLKKYFKVTESAFTEIKKNIFNGKEKEAKEIIEMAKNYISDAHHFKEKKDFVNAFAALNYAHGWIDSGVRLKIFDVNDNRLFTVC
ncbi:MAG: DUF357 domain-containing protein [Candidatus Pacearchaeota archaeon]